MEDVPRQLLSLQKKSIIQAQRKSQKKEEKTGHRQSPMPQAESCAKRRSNGFPTSLMSGKFGMRLLSESSLIRFRGPGRYSTVHRSPPVSFGGGGSDRLESAGLERSL